MCLEIWSIVTHLQKFGSRGSFGLCCHRAILLFFFFSWFENLMVVFNSAKFSGGSPRDYSMATQVDCETDRLELLHSPLQSRTYFHSIARS